MLGKARIDLLDDEAYLLRPGEWMHCKCGQWYARTPPNRSFPKGAVANLTGHNITEHEDRTITVTPSILVTGGGSWHGYLTRGVWSEV